jgi:hypothetical protein
LTDTSPFDATLVDLGFGPYEGCGASFTAVKQLRNHIDAFINAYNQS